MDNIINQLDELNKNIMDKKLTVLEPPDDQGEILRDLENDYNIWRRKVEFWKSNLNENK
jgi:hypothetical protein